MEISDFDMLIKKRRSNYHNAFDKNIIEIVNGIIFMYASWSHSSVQMRSLLKSLEQFPAINLYVFDIDNDAIENYKKLNDVYSDGWGETFWVKEGKIILDMKKYSQSDLPKLILNHSRIDR